MAALVSVLVPFAPAGAERDAAWAWNRRRMERMFPTLELCVGAPDRVGHPGEFSRSLALNRAAELATGHVFAVCDADTTYPSAADFSYATGCALNGEWTLPERYIRLGPRCSSAWMASGFHAPPPTNWERDVEQEYPFANSGVVVLPREAFERVGGFDQRFKGWGGEDDAMRAALEALWSPPTRYGIALHLWHPRPLEHTTGARYNAESRVLADRYGAVAGDPEAMLELIAERE